MKIIFLDIDGVLIKLRRPYKKDFRLFDEDLVIKLQELILLTGAKLVISSSWRHHMDSLRDAFIESGLDWNLVISKTGYDTGGGRATEILQWLDEYHRTCKDGWHITHWCAIDDEAFDMKAIRRIGKLVKTDMTQGLTDESMNEALVILTQ